MTQIPEKAEKLLHFRLCLQAFAEGGGSGGGTGDGAPGPAAQGESGAVKPTGVTTPGVTTSGGEAAEHKQATTEPDYDAEYRQFLERPEMKSRYDKQVSGAIKARFKENEAERTRASRNQRLVDGMAERYGLDPEDHDGIESAFAADVAYETEQAEKNGISTAMQREINRMRSQTAMQQAREAKAENARQMAALRMEAGKLSEKYPGFDLATELKNPEFKGLLDSGRSMETAYRAVHLDEITEAVAAHTRKEAETRIADNIRANRARPVEGGAGGGAPKPAEPVDFTKMSDAEWRALSERTRSGYRVPFT